MVNDNIRALVPASTGGIMPSPQEWKTCVEMAEVLYKSKLLPSSVQSVQAAVAIILKGRELGIPPMQAFASIAVVNGKPTLMAELMLALIYRDHGDDALHFTRTDAQECRISYKRRGWAKRQEFPFSIEDAKRANLIKGGPWSQYPAAMLRARAISAVARMAFPDSIGGMHTPEEVGGAVTVDATGQVVVEDAPAPTEPDELAQLRDEVRAYEHTDLVGIQAIEKKYGSIDSLPLETVEKALTWLEGRGEERARLAVLEVAQGGTETPTAPAHPADVDLRVAELNGFVDLAQEWMAEARKHKGPMKPVDAEKWRALYTHGQFLTQVDSPIVADVVVTELANWTNTFVKAALAELTELLPDGGETAGSVGGAL